MFVVHPAALIPVQPHHFPFTTGISFRLYKLTGRLPLVITSVPLIYHSCRRVLTANILFQRLFTTNFPRASFFCYSFLLANQGVGHSLDYTLRFNYAVTSKNAGLEIMHKQVVCLDVVYRHLRTICCAGH